MSTATFTAVGDSNHPAGQVTLFPQRSVASRASALGGYGFSSIRRDGFFTMVQTAVIPMSDAVR